MLRIAEDCVSQGHEVTIYTGQWRGDKPKGKINVEILPSKGLLNHQRHQSLIEAMHEAIQKDPVDLVVGFNRMPNLDVYFAADPCFLARAFEEKNCLYRLTSRYRFFRDCEKSVFGTQTDCQILSLTQRDQSVFQHWYQTPSNRFHMIPPNIPVDKFAGKKQAQCRTYLRAQFGLPSAANVILTVGSAYLRKGVDRAVVALSSLPEALRKNTWLIAIGEHESGGRFLQDAKKLGVADQCILAGGRSDVAELMLGANLLAHPARSELAGLVIIEAMTAGLPVLVTDICGYAHHVKDANAGVLVGTPFQQSALNSALFEMLTTSSDHWSKNALKYTTKLMHSNPPQFEASFLIATAKKKSKKYEVI